VKVEKRQDADGHVIWSHNERDDWSTSEVTIGNLDRRSANLSKLGDRQSLTKKQMAFQLWTDVQLVSRTRSRMT